MRLEPPFVRPTTTADLTLQAYLLGSVEFEAALALQRRLAFHIAGERASAALLLCEHPPLITVGRQGSRAHILCEPDELRARQWRVRWVNRGGGCLLPLPGQLAAYPLLPLDRLGLGLQAYLDRLHEVVIAVLDDFSVQGETRPGQPGVWAEGRPIAGCGVAVRDWVSYYGIYLNIAPDLEPFRRLRFAGSVDHGQMTSLARERRGLVRPAHVRQRFLEHFAARFRIDDVALFTDHPALAKRAPSDAVATNR
jgi:lipoyl(octanoyl) transferase